MNRPPTLEGRPVPASVLVPASGLSCITFPWEVPKNTIVVEVDEGQWRVVSYGRSVAIFRTREDALAHARKIAVLYIPEWTIVEHDTPSSQAVAGGAATCRRAGALPKCL